MTSDEERRLILEMIESGKISADEGLRLLKALEEAEDESSPAPPLSEFKISESRSQPSQAATMANVNLRGAPDAGAAPMLNRSAVVPPPQARGWRRWWLIPLGLGLGLIILAAWWMQRAIQTRGLGWEFYCAWLPLAFGLAIILLAWQSRSLRWVHVRIEQKPPKWPSKIQLSFPLPTGLISWLLRHVGVKIPALERSAVDELLLALEKTVSNDQPIYIDIDEGQDGEKVQVYIG